MMIFNVFGKHLAVKREQGHWQVYRADLSERKFSRLYEVVIPDEISAEEIVQWLDDIYHESATDKHPAITRIE